MLSIVKKAVVDKLSGLNFFIVTDGIKTLLQYGFSFKNTKSKIQRKGKSGSIIVAAK